MSNMEPKPSQEAAEDLDQLTMKDFIRTSADVAEGSLLITGGGTPNEQQKRQAVGMAPIAEHISEALDHDDFETARVLHEQNPKHPPKQ